MARLFLVAALALAPLKLDPSGPGFGKVAAAVALASDGDSGGSGRGRGRGGDNDADDDADNSGSGGSGGSGSGGSGGGSVPDRGGILRIEVSLSGIEVRYADGARERIERGRYEFRDARGRTVEQRRATGADVSRLRALSENAAVRGAPAARMPERGLRALHVEGRDIVVDYANGWSEEVRDRTYRLIDAFGRVVARRAATEEDRIRLLAGGS